mgnify:CR=1 FL=1
MMKISHVIYKANDLNKYIPFHHMIQLKHRYLSIELAAIN